MVLLAVVNYILNIVAAVDKLSRNGNLVTGLIKTVANNITDSGKTNKNAPSVRIAKASLHIIFLIKRRIYGVIFLGQNRQLVYERKISHACHLPY